jgi:hypothetical protein
VVCTVTCVGGECFDELGSEAVGKNLRNGKVLSLYILCSRTTHCV